MTKEMKIKLFENMLALEKLAEKETYDGRNYFEQTEGFYKALITLGLNKEYLNWSVGK